MPGVVVSLGLLLLALIAGWRIVSADAGPDPAKWLLHQAGFWALILLCATLAISTSRRISGKASLMRWRRPLGLAAFSAASAHVLVYLTVFHGLDVAAIVDDIARRKYIMVGAAAWVLLLPMALTSTRASRRKLGARWTTIHRAIYIIVPLAVIHQGMAQKADLGQTIIFSTIVACFLIERWWAARRRGKGAV
jgi:sulfoxide reductase heme-binding subunit YedZ